MCKDLSEKTLLHGRRWFVFTILAFPAFLIIATNVFVISTARLSKERLDANNWA